MQGRFGRGHLQEVKGAWRPEGGWASLEVGRPGVSLAGQRGSKVWGGEWGYEAPADV